MANLQKTGKKHHVVPETYIRQWCPNPKIGKVYGIDLKNRYHFEVRERGLGEKIFAIDDFYDDERLLNPNVPDMFLRDHIEPIYPRIIGNIKREENLDIDCRVKIMTWIIFSLFRSPIFRKMLFTVANTASKLISELQNDETENVEIMSLSQRMSRNVSLSLFNVKESKELLNILELSMGLRVWRILKAPPGHEFLTCENPGFSIIPDPLAPDGFKFGLISVDPLSRIYYPLSPGYCLLMCQESSPPLFEIGLNAPIQYQICPYEEVYKINCGTINNSRNILIGSSRVILEFYKSGLKRKER